MKKALVFAAVAETLTGLALAVTPSLVGWLLLGQELAGVAAAVARVAGIALIGLGVACWPGPPILGMLIYSASASFISGTSAPQAPRPASCFGRPSLCTSF